MITLITGINGSGKGVFGLDTIIKKANDENRQVYYHGIPDCKVPGWIELDDPKQWMSLPPNSIFVQDEAQEIYPPMSSSVIAPPHIMKLGRHRQEFGLDMYFMTPHPMGVHSMLRRGAGQHFHLVRKWGREESVVHEFQQARENVDKNRKDSLTKSYKFNKSIFGLYASAPAHTMKSRTPLRVVMMWCLPIPIIVLAYFAYHQYGKAKTLNTVSDVQPLLGSNLTSLPQTLPVDWFKQQTPRVAELPQTAPKYDELTKPVNVPFPAACVASTRKCVCVTNQGTKFNTSDLICRQIVKDGFFKDFDDTKKSNQTEVAQNRNGGLLGGERPLMALAKPYNAI